MVTQDSRGKFWNRLASSSVRSSSITVANLAVHSLYDLFVADMKQQNSRDFASSVGSLLLTWGCLACTSLGLYCDWLGCSGFVLFLLNYCHHERKRQICCFMH
eukprot:7438077-Ditylum_brightwellii.AAC.1